MKVSEIMDLPAIVVHESATLAEAARLMLQHGRRGLPVVNSDNTICGFISVSDYLAKEISLPFSRFKAAELFGKWIPNERIEDIYDAAQSMLVKTIMSTPPFTVEENDSVEHLVELMMRYGLSRIPVIRDKHPVGIVTRLNLLKLMVR